MGWSRHGGDFDRDKLAQQTVRHAAAAVRVKITNRHIRDHVVYTFVLQLSIMFTYIMDNGVYCMLAI